MPKSMPRNRRENKPLSQPMGKNLAQPKKIPTETNQSGQLPFKGYEKLRAEEIKELKKMTLKESIRLTEILLKEAEKWKR